MVGDRTAGNPSDVNRGYPSPRMNGMKGVRTRIGAEKRRNGRGAKAGRKVDA